MPSTKTGPDFWTTDDFEKALRVLADQYNLYPYRTENQEWIMSNGSSVDVRVMEDNYSLGGRSEHVVGGSRSAVSAPFPTLREAVEHAVHVLTDRYEEQLKKERDATRQTENTLAVLIGLGAEA